MSNEMVQGMEITTENGRPIRLAYDETGDVLEIAFGDVEATCAVERIITTAPVNRFLKVSILDSFSVHPIPLTYIESPYAAFTAA